MQQQPSTTMWERRVEENERAVRALLKEKRAQDDPEVVRARGKISSDLTAAMVGSDVGDDDTLADRWWKLCFHKRIDDYRKRIASLPAGAAQRKLVSEFRQFLGEATKAFSAVCDALQNLQKPHILARLYTCLGDIARYRELVSENEEKRWTEAAAWYRRATETHLEAGGAHNQLAVIAGYQNRNLVSAYRYERALGCAKPFDAAKQNLHVLLTQVLSAPPPPASSSSTPERDRFLDRYLRLHARVLLPQSPLDEADELRGLVRGELDELLASSAIRGELGTALLLSAIFAVAHGDVFEPLRSGDQVRVASALFEHVAGAFIARACVQPTEARALFQVCILCDLFAHNPRLVTKTMKHALEELDSVIAPSLLRAGAIAAEGEKGNAWDEDEVEVVGFLPLGRMMLTQHNTKPVDVLERLRKIHRFVRDLVHNELRPFAVDGIVHTVRSQSSSATALVDEEEEILFKPAFAATKNPLVGGNMSARPPPAYPLFAGEGLSNATWGNPSNPTNPFSWVSTNWGSNGTASSSSSSRVAVSPPPGFSSYSTGT